MYLNVFELNEWHTSVCSLCHRSSSRGVESDHAEVLRPKESGALEMKCLTSDGHLIPQLLSVVVVHTHKEPAAAEGCYESAGGLLDGAVSCD